MDQRKARYRTPLVLQIRDLATRRQLLAGSVLDDFSEVSTSGHETLDYDAETPGGFTHEWE